MERFENAKIGDEVFCEVYGYGKLVSLTVPSGSTYPVVAKFSSEYRESYMLDGRIRKEATKPTLFYRKGTERNLTERPGEEINWKEYVGKPILVRDTYRGSSTKRKLYSYAPELDEPFICFREHIDGRVLNDICTWKYAKLIETVVEEKQQEIDWTKVATGTQVIVSDSDDFYPCNTREFFMYRPDLEYKFWVFDGEKDEAYGYKYCKII